VKVILVPPSHVSSHQHQVQIYAQHGGQPAIGAADQVFLMIDHLPQYLSIYGIEPWNSAYIGSTNLNHNIWGMDEIEQWVGENCRGVVLAQFGTDNSIMLYFEDGKKRAADFISWIYAQRRRTQFTLHGPRNRVEEMKDWLKENGTGKIDFMKRGNTIAIADQKTAAKFYLVFSDNVEELS
jgi:hypothetical protein